jgi:chaperonin GroES
VALMLRAHPLGPRVLVKPLEAADSTSAGVVLPEGVRGKESRGVVVAAGAWWRHDSYGVPEEQLDAPFPVSPGDVVVYPRGAGIEVTLDLSETGEQEDLLLLHINDCLLRLEEIEVRNRDESHR